MGKGRKIICCCESSCWCFTIEIIYWIVGVIFILNAAVAFFYCKDKVVFEEKWQEQLCSSSYSDHRYVRRLVEGVYYFCMGLLLYCGVKKKSSVLLCVFIVIKMVYFVLAIIVAVLQMTNSSTEVYNDVIHLLLVILLNGVVPYIVWVHKKEIC